MLCCGASVEEQVQTAVESVTGRGNAESPPWQSVTQPSFPPLHTATTRLAAHVPATGSNDQAESTDQPIKVDLNLMTIKTTLWGNINT